MKTAVITIKDSARETAEKIRDYLGNADIHENAGPGKLPELVTSLFREYEGLVFLTATGIAVRMIAPHVSSKYSDPAVVVVDEACRFSISLLSGHEGGANTLAYKVAAAVGGEPVVTTATETARPVTIGIGCRRGASADEVLGGILSAIKESGVERESIRCAASVSLKRDEQGLLEACGSINLPLRFFTREQINSLRGDFTESDVALKHLGIRAVAEPCALLAGRNPDLILKKKKYGPVTVAVAREVTERKESL